MAATDRSAPQNASQLTGFQRDLLYTIAGIGPARGLELKDDLQQYYTSEINHGRLYPNLDTLVDMGLVEKGRMDKRSNSYELTDRGEQLVAQRQEWERGHIEA